MTDYGPNTDNSGGTRYSAGKPSGWWFAPLAGLRLVADVWKAGGEKYAPMDWKAGQYFSTLVDCLFRHLLAMQEKGIWSRDPDLGTYHAANACWNLLCLLTFMVQNRHDLDDITPYEGVTADEYHCARMDAALLGIPVHEVLRSRRDISSAVGDVGDTAEDADYRGDGENAHIEGDSSNE